MFDISGFMFYNLTMSYKADKKLNIPFFYNIARMNLDKNIKSNLDCQWLSEDFRFVDNYCLYFIYKNTVFSVLVNIKDSDGTSYLSNTLIDNQLSEAKKYNFIPVQFPITIDNIENKHPAHPAAEGWNLLSSVTNDFIDPETFVSDKKIPLSEFELRILSVKAVTQYLISKKYNIASIKFSCDNVPHIWVKTSVGDLFWITVNESINQLKKSDICENCINNFGNYEGFYAQVAVLSGNVDKPHRGEDFSLKITEFDKINTIHTDIENENISELIKKTLLMHPIELTDELGIYPVPYYSDLILKINSDYINHPETIPDNLVLIPIKYKNDVEKNPNFGLYLYHIDKDGSDYAKRGYVYPKEVILANKVDISIIRKVSGMTVAQKYFLSFGRFQGTFDDDPMRKQCVTLYEIFNKYGRGVAAKALDLCREGTIKIEMNYLADGSPEYEFSKPIQFFKLYSEFLNDYLNYLRLISDFPQSSYESATNNILCQKEFQFDFNHTGNTFVDFDKQEFNFIDFYFDDYKIDNLKDTNMLELFRNVLLGIHVYSKTQPMDFIFYQSDLDLYKGYVKTITEKINNSAPDDHNIEEKFFLDN